MKNVVVVGSQWGDEGKGKIVDWLSSEADIIVRFQGGHNAGHTLVIDGVTYKLRLLPSGIVRKDKVSIIGNGVVVDPWSLLDEIKEIKSKGIEINQENFQDVLGHLGHLGCEECSKKCWPCLSRPFAPAKEDAEHQGNQKKLSHQVAAYFVSLSHCMFYQSWISRKSMIGLMIGIAMS